MQDTKQLYSTAVLRQMKFDGALRELRRLDERANSVGVVDVTRGVDAGTPSVQRSAHGPQQRFVGRDVDADLPLLQRSAHAPNAERGVDAGTPPVQRSAHAPQRRGGWKRTPSSCTPEYEELGHSTMCEYEDSPDATNLGTDFCSGVFHIGRRAVDSCLR